jgi:hypothetical protein
MFHQVLRKKVPFSSSAYLRVVDGSKYNEYLLNVSNSLVFIMEIERTYCEVGMLCLNMVYIN